MNEEQRKRVKPGFTRVFIPARNKTILVRTAHTKNQTYMMRNGLVLMPTAMPPAMPPKPVTPEPMRVEAAVEAPKPAPAKKKRPAPKPKTQTVS